MAASLSGREVAGVYLFLKKRERELDPTLTALLNRLEQILYDALSIEELESLDDIYKSDETFFRLSG